MASLQLKVPVRLDDGGTLVLETEERSTFRDAAGREEGGSTCGYQGFSFRKAVRVFAELQEALTARDAGRAAELMIYPLHVNTAPYKGTTVDNRAAFVRDFDRIFPGKLTAHVLDVDPRRVTCRASGFYLGLGVLYGRASGGRHGVFVVNQAEWLEADGGAPP